MGHRLQNSSFLLYFGCHACSNCLFKFSSSDVLGEKLFAKIAHDSLLGGACLPSQNLSCCGAIIFFTCIGITHSWSCTFGASVGRWVRLVTARLHPVLHACSRSTFWNRFFGLMDTGASLSALRSPLPVLWGRGVRLARTNLFRAPLGSTQA